jgi:hypothetical protein
MMMLWGVEGVGGASLASTLMGDTVVKRSTMHSNQDEPDDNSGV